MFQPNSVGSLARLVGRDVHGRNTYGGFQPCAFAPVNLLVGSQKTSVRADSSASRGSADEFAALRAKVLFPIYLGVRIGDRFRFRHVTYQVATIHARMDILGRHDHDECDLEVVP